MFRSLSVVLGLVVLFAGCGPSAGGQCSEEGAGVCDTATSALVCEGGHFRVIPCRGTAGCVSSGSRFACSFQPLDGDPCPQTSEGNALCDAANPDRGFKCTLGSWVGQACRSCSVAAGEVTCLTP